MTTPSQLAAQLTKLVARACRCETSWAQHPGPLTAHEAAKIYGDALVLLLSEYETAVTCELAAKAKALEQMHIQNLGADVQG